MDNYPILFNVLYALAAREGREKALFGDCISGAREAFGRSLAGTSFPELWFELPLMGKPWFDLHALTSHESMNPDTPPAAEVCGGNPEAFAWFAAQKSGVRQLALSWDVSSGDVNDPAVQLLVSSNDSDVPCSFLTAAGRPDAALSYRAFVERLPEEWFTCYSGVFPKRTTPHLRVECIPDPDLQQAYAEDAALLEAHLLQTGLAELGDTTVARCQELARTPFHLEFQFDVDPDGRAGATFGASVRFEPPVETDFWQPFDPDRAAGALMQQVESWGLSDERWRLLAGTTFSKRISRNGDSLLLFCYPTFLKLRWREGQPLDAKVYLIAGGE